MPEDDEGQNDHPNVVALQDTNAETARKRLPYFIKTNTAAIVSEWEAFARTLIPWSEGMTPHALRDHIHQILAFIEVDVASYQTPVEQTQKSHGQKKQTEPVTAAQTHAAVRFTGGFDIGQMASEYRALRASVLKLWTKTGPAFDAADIADMIRFNEAIDQELAESVNFYTDRVAQSRELVVAMLSHDLRSPLQGIALATELPSRSPAAPHSSFDAGARATRVHAIRARASAAPAARAIRGAASRRRPNPHGRASWLRPRPKRRPMREEPEVNA